MTVGSPDTGRLLDTLLEGLQAPPWAGGLSWTNAKLLILLGCWTPVNRADRLAQLMHTYMVLAMGPTETQGEAR